jgi:hypothetical protein
MGLLILDETTLPNGIVSQNIILSIHSNFYLFKSVLNIYTAQCTVAYYISNNSYLTRVPIYTSIENITVPPDQLSDIITFIYNQIKSKYINTQFY